MSRKHCEACGIKIPRKFPHTGIKTNQNRRFCFTCRPPESPHKSNSERKRRKKLLVDMLGGKCVKCGYNKSIAALSFHHLIPKNKLFDISQNGSMLREWDEVVQEAKKCELLCLNCHAEHHNQ